MNTEPRHYRYHQDRRSAGFTLVEIMIVVLIIGVLLNIAVPNFVQARESARAKACVANMKQLDSAVQQYVIDNKLTAFTNGTLSAAPGSLLIYSSSNTGGYIRQRPLCPSGGTYSTGDGGANRPTCTIGTQTPAQNSHQLP